MLVFLKDAGNVHQLIQDRTDKGYDWLAYKQDEFVIDETNLVFFKTKDEAIRFSNDSKNVGVIYELKEGSAIVHGMESHLSIPGETDKLFYFRIDENNNFLLNNFRINSLQNQIQDQNLNGWEKELLGYPIKEPSNDLSIAVLLRHIDAGEAGLITLEKQIVPELLIADYCLVKHEYPKGTIYETGHRIEELGYYPNYQKAFEEVNKIGKDLILAEPMGNWELALIGRYEGKKLEYNYEGIPEPETGYCIGVSKQIGLPENQVDFEFHLYKRIDSVVSIYGHLYVEKDASGEHVMFSDIIGQRKELDRSFWNSSKPEQVEVLKHQLNRYGFDAIDFDELKENVKAGRSFFQMQHQEMKGDDLMRYRLHFQKGNNGTFDLQIFEADLQKPIIVNPAIVNGVNTLELESRMKSIDWNKEYTKLSGTQANEAKRVVEDLSKLDSISRAQLKAKYWQDKPWGNSLDSKMLFYMVSDYHNMKKTFNVNPYENISSQRAYEILDRRSELVRKLETKFTEVLQSSNNKQTMKENVENVQDTVKYHGFGEKHNDEISKKIASGVKEFQITDETIFQNRKMESVLNFKQANNGNYYFNNYRSTMTHADGMPLNGVSQTFYLDKGKGFTLKEAMNLLDGRGVYKEYTSQNKDTYTGWKLIDFDKRSADGQNYGYRIIHDNYGYSIEKALGEIDLKIPAKIPNYMEEMIKSLEKGNLKAVELNSGESIFIAADPASGKLSKLARYDSNMKELTLEMRNIKTATPEVEEDMLPKHSKKNTNKQDDITAGQNGDEKKQRKGRVSKSQNSNDPDLLEKNKKSTGKGQRV